jgi:hypothetical protein
MGLKAKVIATGKIVDVVEKGNYYDTIDNKERYYGHELDFNDTADYWTKLEHQYAGMAMQGILGNQTYTKNLLETSTSAKEARDIIVDASMYLAHAFVEKLKKKEEK